VLPPLLQGERLDYDGERLHADSTSRFGRAGGLGSDAPPLYVGTMFPISLRPPRPRVVASIPIAVCAAGEGDPQREPRVRTLGKRLTPR
jgi:hypothetical protein